MDDQIIQRICIYALPLILAITVHEAAHAFAANKYGDNTAKMLGRLSLNPLVHIDLFGTIIFPLLSLVLFSGVGIIFGWAKPVPINFFKLHNPKRDLRYVALAGPLSNLAMALVWALLLKVSLYVPDYARTLLFLMSQAGISINIGLMLLNLLPILPLDGGRIVYSLLPDNLAFRYSKSERFGFFILILLILVGALNYIIMPLYAIITSFIIGLVL